MPASRQRHEGLHKSTINHEGNKQNQKTNLILLEMKNHENGGDEFDARILRKLTFATSQRNLLIQL
jgi:hypothetical protein